jgi:hypothetical protein
VRASKLTTKRQNVEPATAITTTAQASEQRTDDGIYIQKQLADDDDKSRPRRSIRD